MQTLRMMFRALVMGVCLIGVAMWGLSGWPMPPVARDALDRALEWKDQIAARSSDKPSEAPPQAPTVEVGQPHDGAPSAPVWKVKDQTPVDSGGASREAVMAGPQRIDGGIRTQGGSYSPAAPPAAASQYPAPYPGQGNPTLAAATTGGAAPPVRLASGELGAGPMGSGDSDVVHAGGDSPPLSGDSAHRSDAVLAAIGRQLQGLGAIEYRLERWAGQTPLYRFTCQVAIGDNPDFHRHFEATEESPYVAMSEVLSQVQSWRSAAASGPSNRGPP